MHHLICYVLKILTVLSVWTRFCCISWIFLDWF